MATTLKSRVSEVARSPRTERSISVSVGSSGGKKAKLKKQDKRMSSSPYTALVEAGARLAGDCDAIPESTFGHFNSPASMRTKLLCYHPREVADELCLMDAEFLRKIRAEEMEHGAWMKADKKNLAPNILAMVHASNDLAMLVPTEILAEMTPQSRSKVIVHFIKIANCCLDLHNFNSLKAILAGLQCTPVYRLKKTWKEVPARYKKKFDNFCQLMSEEGNYGKYRRELDETLENNIPCIPFLGVLLTTIVQCSAHNYGLGSRKYSGVEDYTVMEAVTVRNRLERLRKRSSVKYSRSRLVSSGACQVIGEDPHTKKTKPSGDWSMDVTILEEGAANGTTVPHPPSEECNSVPEILGTPSDDHLEKEGACLTADERVEKFRRRSNCLESKMNLFAGSKVDSSAQNNMENGGSKEEIVSESDSLVALSDISLHLNHDSDEATPSEGPYGSADHTHNLEQFEDIRLCEVTVNDNFVQQGVNHMATRKRRNGTTENTFRLCPSNDSIWSANGSDRVSNSSLDSVGMETCVSGVSSAKRLISITSISSITSVSSVDTLGRSLTPQETEVATLDFPAESEDEDSQVERPQGGCLNTRHGGTISRCASDNKVTAPYTGPLSASIHESISMECIRDVMRLRSFDMVEDGSCSLADVSLANSTSAPTSSSQLSSDDEGISPGEDSEFSSTSSPELITPPMMTSPDLLIAFSRMASAPVGCPTEPSPTVAFSSSSSAAKRNTWQPMHQRTVDFSKRNEPQQRKKGKSLRTGRKSRQAEERMQDKDEEPETGPVRRRSRRNASKVLSVALAPSMKIKDWSQILTRYQMLSLGCSGDLSSKPLLRSLILNYPLNPDALNYKLSHDREPNQ